MGLDITAYKNARPARAEIQAVISTAEEPREVAYDLGVVIPWINNHFPGREEGITPGIAYETDKEKICAGLSYGSYNVWRESLGQMVGIANIREWFRNPDMSVPFAELLNFADNEGVLGPVVCKRLAAYFEEWAERAAKYTPRTLEAEHFRRHYATWHAAFKHAACDGFVEYH
ncbi:MAG: hypothetical protein NTZ64_02845 [Polaromonas sp.]|nr:hypothetical protein [Polaromonas sp.]